MMYIFIDTDPGIDDSLALIYMLSQCKYEVVGISSIAGNVNIDLTTKNLQFITGILNEKFNKNIQIFKGISKPIVHVDYNEASKYHGADGLGGFWSSDYAKQNESEIKKICSHCTVSETPAVLALIEMSKRYSGELVVLALGPLGNIALAQMIDPEFGSRLKEIFIMGGDISGAGNCEIHLSAEFNFSTDPEAAYNVFKELKCKKIILPLEVVLPLSVFQEKKKGWLNKLGSNTDLLSSIKQHIINFKGNNKRGFRLYDLTAAIVFLEPELVIETMTANASIELFGKYTRGKVVIDFYSITKGNDFQDFTEINFIKSVNCDEIFTRYDLLF